MSKLFNNDNVLKLEVDIFLPLLNQDLVARNLPITLTQPLAPTDFTDNKFGTTILDIIEDISFFMKCSFSNNDLANHLNKNQWLRATTQVMAAIHQGLYDSFPVNNAKSFLEALGPDRDEATHAFRLAVGTLNYFFTQPPATTEGRWEQCAHCLKISNTNITEEAIQPLLKTCNQDADSARLIILNATIRNFHKKGSTWKDTIRAKAQDQMILEVVSANPPPIKLDQQVLEWIWVYAEQGQIKVETTAMEQVVVDACAAYKAQLAILQKCLQEDLEKIHEPPPSDPCQ
jgi:hypothetical protein